MNLVDDPALLSLPIPDLFERAASEPAPAGYRPGRIGDVVEVDVESMLWAPMPA